MIYCKIKNNSDNKVIFNASLKYKNNTVKYNF